MLSSPTATFTSWAKEGFPSHARIRATLDTIPDPMGFSREGGVQSKDGVGE